MTLAQSFNVRIHQPPVVSPVQFEKVGFGPKTAAQVVGEGVPELTYTSHDLAPFARDTGCVLA